MEYMLLQNMHANKCGPYYTVFAFSIYNNTNINQVRPNHSSLVYT